MCVIAEVVEFIPGYIDGYVVFKLWEVILLYLVLDRFEIEYWS